MNETRRLAEFAVQTFYSDLPSSVVEAVRVYVLDNVASGLLGSTTPWAEMVADMTRESSSGGPCSVFARGWTASPSSAALVNGTMIGGFETDHAFFEGSSHPSAAVFPAALAVAERDRLDGKALLTSVAVGYEVICRVGLAATRAVEDKAGFHGPGTNAPFGGAAGAGKALGLNVEQLVNALGIAGSHAAGLLEFAREGAMTKRLHVGRGAQTGLESALLAQKGFTGPSTVLEGEHGFLKVYSPSPRPELLLDGLGLRYVLMDMTVKGYACHASFHAVIDGLSRLKLERGFDPARVGEVRVVAGERMMESRFLDREPGTVLGAQYSLPFSVAVALCHDVRDPTVYSEATLRDPQVRRLAAEVKLAADAAAFGGPGKPSAKVSVAIEGEVCTFEVTDWKGAPTNPYTYDEMADKFRRYGAVCLSMERTEELIERVGSLEEERDVADLLRLVRV